MKEITGPDRRPYHFGGRRRRSGHVIARAAPKWPSCGVSLPMKIHTVTIGPSQTRVPDSRVDEQEKSPAKNREWTTEMAKGRIRKNELSRPSISPTSLAR